MFQRFTQTLLFYFPIIKTLHPFYQHYRFSFTLLSVFLSIVMFLSRMSHCYQCKVFQHSGAEIANLCREFWNLMLCARRILIIIFFNNMVSIEKRFYSDRIPLLVTTNALLFWLSLYSTVCHLPHHVLPAPVQLQHWFQWQQQHLSVARQSN